MPDAAAFIMTQLYLKSFMKFRKVKGLATAKYEMKQIHFRDTFKLRHYRKLNKYHKKSILESHRRRYYQSQNRGRRKQAKGIHIQI